MKTSGTLRLHHVHTYQRWTFIGFRCALFFSCLLFNLSLTAQDSLVSKQLQEVVVTATRSEREIASLPVPVTVIQQSQIKNMGSLRLNEVLGEQTGLAVVSDHGTGIQMQGFTPEYTLILVDGEPLIGRTSGVLELNRISVGNIQQIEIMKGPSSSLYGSEALAGVINIITQRPNGINGTLTSRYGTNQTLDVGASVNYQQNKFGLYAFANRYHTEGYDLSSEQVGNTVSPFTNYTYQTRLTYDFSTRTKFSLSARYFTEQQKSVTAAETSDPPLLLNGIGTVRDWNLNPVLSHTFSDKLKATFRFYGSGYNTNSTLAYQQDGAVYEATFFDQTFYRPELQTEYFLNSKNIVTLGIGRIWESVEASRYDGKMKYHTDYAYVQYEWQPLEKLNFLAGARYDKHSAYGSQLSPKLSVQYDVNAWLSVRGSTGVGFKAPDFRQLYLNFTNSTVGYSVLGSQALVEGIRRLEEAGQISEILIDPTTFGDIKAETSMAYNVGFKIRPYKNTSVNLNFFRNDIKDLIDTKPVARKTNNQYVYSYYNLAEVFTQGLEGEVLYQPTTKLNLSLGYQLLIAKDKAEIRDIKAGIKHARDPETNVVSRVSLDDYGGLFNRSRHMLNGKIFYNDQQRGWNANARFIYRGRYGFADRNNNSLLDDDSEYVDGYLTCNVSLGKTFEEIFKVQVGCDNLFNYTEAEYIPTLPGRLLWASIALTLSKKTIQTK